MRIAVIGGRYRNEGQLSRIATAAGYELEFEEGHMRGRGPDAIRRAVARSSLVVIVTDVNSHGAVQMAKKAARQLERPTLIVQNFGAVRLCRLLEALERRKLRDQEQLPLASGMAF
ncbi:MAG TPA: DUF2325 domain-containing protein [Polyangiaceae bacterium]|nr:DUF2325 domain-containing protein [Polyangiaceae bacterium]